MTYSSIFIINTLKLKDKNYSLNRIVNYLKNNFKEHGKTPKRSVISLWIKLYNKNLSLLDIKLSNLYSKIKRNNEKYINIDLLNYIFDLVKIDPFIERRKIIYLVSKKFNIKISLNKVSLIYRKLKLTWKKPRKYCVKNELFLEEIQKNRKIFREEIQKKTIESIISIDESGFNNLFLNNKGLSPKGERIHVPITNLREKNISLLLALTTKGIIHHIETSNTINGDVFYNFLKEVIERINNNIKYTFIFDNVSFHRLKKIKDLINSNGHELLFCPPYSPNNNPIENLFSLIKNEFKKNVKINKEKNEKGRRNRNYIKNMILLSIKNIENIYNSIYISLFNRSFQYDYTDIVKELKDRLIFKNSNNNYLTI
jgi:transposase